VTPFGKAIRKLRIEAEPKITMSAMAKDLGKLPSYLSDVELGEKQLSDEFAREIIAYLRNHPYFKKYKQLVDEDYLLRLADRTRRTVDVQKLEDREREAVATFARRLPTLPAPKRAQIKKKLEDVLNDMEEE
jgi:transcriptional regulator with XRE-family HTH domain